MPRTKQSTLASRLRAARESAGLSRAALADKASVSPATIEKLEMGSKDDPRLSTLRALSRALGIPIGALLYRT
jgi:transcriptional regulator with XRE-family HTH domain